MLRRCCSSKWTFSLVVPLRGSESSGSHVLESVTLSPSLAAYLSPASTQLWPLVSRNVSAKNSQNQREPIRNNHRRRPQSGKLMPHVFERRCARSRFPLRWWRLSSSILEPQRLPGSFRHLRRSSGFSLAPQLGHNSHPQIGDSHSALALFGFRGRFPRHIASSWHFYPLLCQVWQGLRGCRPGFHAVVDMFHPGSWSPKCCWPLWKDIWLDGGRIQSKSLWLSEKSFLISDYTCNVVERDKELGKTLLVDRQKSNGEIQYLRNNKSVSVSSNATVTTGKAWLRELQAFMCVLTEGLNLAWITDCKGRWQPLDTEVQLLRIRRRYHILSWSRVSHGCNAGTIRKADQSLFGPQETTDSWSRLHRSEICALFSLLRLEGRLPR